MSAAQCCAVPRSTAPYGAEPRRTAPYGAVLRCTAQHLLRRTARSVNGPLGSPSLRSGKTGLRAIENTAKVYDKKSNLYDLYALDNLCDAITCNMICK